MSIKQYIAAMDIGTSGCKSIIVDEEGVVVSSVIEEYPLYSPRPGWNERILSRTRRTGGGELIQAFIKQWTKAK